MARKRKTKTLPNPGLGRSVLSIVRPDTKPEIDIDMIVKSLIGGCRPGDPEIPRKVRDDIAEFHDRLHRQIHTGVEQAIHNRSIEAKAPDFILGSDEDEDLVRIRQNLDERRGRSRSR